MSSSLAYLHEPPDDHAIHVPADPNGLAYDCNDDALYIADGGGAVIAVEQGHRRRIATIDAAGCTANQLGGIAVTPDGTLYVVRIGQGHCGAIFEVTPQGAVRALPGLSPHVWRLGVVYDAGEHALYTTRYHKPASRPCRGAIDRIDLTTGQVRTILDGLGKPVGIAKLGANLVVSDKLRGGVLRIGLSGDRAVRVSELATGIDRPDSLAACGVDAVVLTTYCAETGIGTLRKLWLDGTIETVVRGCWEPRGVASDGDRAFVAIRRGGRVLVFRI